MGTDKGTTFGGGFNTALGLKPVKLTAEEVIAELRVQPSHHQPWGIVHGGVYCSIVETVCSIGGQLAVGATGGFVVGVDNHTSFEGDAQRRFARGGAALALSKRTQLWEANIQNENGDLVATGRVRLMVVEAGKMLAGEVAGLKQ